MTQGHATEAEAAAAGDLAGAYEVCSAEADEECRVLLWAEMERRALKAAAVKRALMAQLESLSFKPA